MIPLKKAKGRVLFNFPGTSRQPAKTTIEGQCSPSPFLCVEARKTIKRQVSQFQRHLQTFYAPLSFSLSLSLFSSVLVCVCGYGTWNAKVFTHWKLRVEEQEHRDNQDPLPSARTPKKLEKKLNYLCCWSGLGGSPWWKSGCLCVSACEWLCEYAHKSMQRILIENVCRKCGHQGSVWRFHTTMGQEQYGNDENNQILLLYIYWVSILKKNERK